MRRGRESDDDVRTASDVETTERRSVRAWHALHSGSGTLPRAITDIYTQLWHPALKLEGKGKSGCLVVRGLPFARRGGGGGGGSEKAPNFSDFVALSCLFFFGFFFYVILFVAVSFVEKKEKALAIERPTRCADFRQAGSRRKQMAGFCV